MTKEEQEAEMQRIDEELEILEAMKFYQDRDRFYGHISDDQE